MHNFIGQSEVKDIMTSPIKTLTSLLKASTYCDISDNFCLDLQNFHYSMFMHVCIEYIYLILFLFILRDGSGCEGQL